MELLQVLTSQLGISDTQAKGGAGLIFKTAKDKLSAAEFGKVESAVPGIGDMMSAAPAPGGAAGALGGLGGLASSLGGSAGQLGNLASLAGGFKSLNLDTGMIAKFMPIVLSFVQTRGGDGVKSILEKALR